MKRLTLLLALLSAVTVLALQHAHPEKAAAPKSAEEKQLAGAADHSMSHHPMAMSAHMKLTPLRPATPADKERAAKVAAQTRAAIEKYKDYKGAEADGYKIFLPNVKQQKMFHFTNYLYAAEAAFVFDPARPTSLLYAKEGDGYRLIGAMFTAPKFVSQEELDSRVPLSVAQWHAHVNMCAPPRDRRQEMWGKDPKFGLLGSITTKEACDAAGGRFFPQVFGWMVHLYPFEPDPRQVWSVERQMAHKD